MIISNHWQLYQAKNKLTEVIKTAKERGPQFITIRGQEEAVVLCVADYQKITRNETDLVTFFQNSPLKHLHLDTERSKDLGREIEF